MKPSRKSTKDTGSPLTCSRLIATQNAQNFSQIYTRAGIDAFSHSWEDEVVWICPPIREVIRIVRKLKKSKVSGVIFIPEWKTADY
jgi:hypothetical protein